MVFKVACRHWCLWSLLRELVSRYTTMLVLDAEDGMRVEANTVYIIPPNRDMSILHGSLQLCLRQKRVFTRSVEG